MLSNNFCVIDNDFGILANHTSLLNCNAALKIPSPESDGKISTLNQHGYMVVDNDDIVDAFIEYATYKEGIFLDIGCAYGDVVKKLLAKGIKIIANDIDENHLLLVRNTTPENQWQNLFLNKNRFPNELNLPNNSLSAVLIRHVMHFLMPEEIHLGLKKIHQWLIANGKLFIVVMSPYHHYYKDFYLTYEERWLENNLWPGLIPNLKDYLPAEAEKIPDFLHVMDYRPLHKALEQNGFATEKIILFDYKNHPKPESVGLPGFCGIIARKKQ